MIRLFFWRLTFELLDLLDLMGFKFKNVYYFAYGGNLSTEVLKLRDITVYHEFPYILENYKLVFDQPGPFLGSGFASVRQAKLNNVYGKIYQISLIDKWRLHFFEASLFLAKYKVITQKKGNLSYFFYQTNIPKLGLLPTQQYLTKILSCYKDYGPEADHFVETLKNWPVLINQIPAKNINLIIQNYLFFGKKCEKLVRKYDHLLTTFFLKLIWRPGIFKTFLQKYF